MWRRREDVFTRQNKRKHARDNDTRGWDDQQNDEGLVCCRVKKRNFWAKFTTTANKKNGRKRTTRKQAKLVDGGGTNDSAAMSSSFSSLHAPARPHNRVRREGMIGGAASRTLSQFHHHRRRKATAVSPPLTWMRYQPLYCRRQLLLPWLWMVSCGNSLSSPSPSWLFGITPSPRSPVSFCLGFLARFNKKCLLHTHDPLIR